MKTSFSWNIEVTIQSFDTDLLCVFTFVAVKLDRIYVLLQLTAENLFKDSKIRIPDEKVSLI